MRVKDAGLKHHETMSRYHNLDPCSKFCSMPRCLPNSLCNMSYQVPLKDSNNPWRTPYTPLNPQWRTRQEEVPPPFPLTYRTQPLQIPKLPNRRPPLHQQPLVQRPTLTQPRRPGLKSKRVPGHRREMPVVQPSHARFVGLHPDHLGLSGDGLAVVEVAPETAADDQDVPGVRECALVFQGLFDLGDGDLVALYGLAGGAAGFLVPARPVY